MEGQYEIRTFNNGSGDVCEIFLGDEVVMSMGAYGRGMSREEAERVLPVADLVHRITKEYRDLRDIRERVYRAEVRSAREAGMKAGKALADVTIADLKDEILVRSEENAVLRESNDVLRARLMRYEEDEVDGVEDVLREIEKEFSFWGRVSIGLSRMWGELRRVV